MTTSDLTVRSLADADLSTFLALDGPSFGPPGRDFMEVVGSGHYRPEWTWVAESGGRVVARAAWWGGPDDERPLALDWFDITPEVDDPVAVGAALLGTAHETVQAADGGLVEYHLFLPPGWRDQPDVERPASVRLAAAEQAGLRPFVERLRFEWRPPSGDAAAGPDHSRRLVLSPVPDDPELLAVLERVAEGTLDAYTRRDVDRTGVASAAREQLDVMDWMPAPRDWWRLAHTPGGDLAGIVMPSRNYEVAVIGYLAVVPEQRGHGYAGELLAWATGFLATQGEDRIVADTDTGNHPMAAAFVAAGYELIGQRIVLA